MLSPLYCLIWIIYSPSLFIVFVSNMATPLRYSDYTVAILTALPIEHTAMVAMLDQDFPSLPATAQDHNTYSYGSIGGHNVVVGCSGVGKVKAGTFAVQMKNTFPCLKNQFSVGSGGGVSRMESDGVQDIRLGDVVVSEPRGLLPGVAEYDFGKALPNGTFERTGVLNKPPRHLLAAVTVRQQEECEQDYKGILHHMEAAMLKNKKYQTVFHRPDSESDRLYRAQYAHQSRIPGSCKDCQTDHMVTRPARSPEVPHLHYGIIASGDSLMKNGILRDTIATKCSALCFEMEAAGLMDDFPCLVVRGISSYADSHKNKQWQPYAAFAAAAYVKALLCIMPAPQAHAQSLLQRQSTPGSNVTEVYSWV